MASRRFGSVMLRAAGGLVAVWLIAPVLIVIPLAFTGKQTFEFPPESWSLQWFSNLFTDSAWRNALVNSVEIALIVVVVTLVLGTACALGLDRSRLRGKPVLQALLLAPMIVPLVVSAVGMYAIGLDVSLVGKTAGFVLAHTALALPFVIVAVLVSLSGFDRQLELAAASLGASPWVSFVRVTLPSISPGLAAGAVFAFITSFDEVVVSQFLADPFKQTVPVKMFQTIEDVDPTIASASTLVLAMTTAIMILALAANRSRRRSAGIET